MTASDFLALIHPALAVILVFPLIGIVVNFAWATRQRRLQLAEGIKSKIPPVVGKEHVQLGRWLASAVVILSLVGFAYAIVLKNIVANNLWNSDPFQTVFLFLLFALTVASLVFLYRARQKLWRGVFATLTGMGIVILGCQDGVFRRSDEWYWSHFYLGIAATLLMIFSLAIIQDIYQDKSLTWRRVHIILNSIALLFFVGQGFTGVRDLFEIGFYANAK
ncbi:MAG: DUF4079 domain-containing protein [Spirulinaceae cyanobacterium]